jgi:uncharacterized protein (DUF1330 family)
LGRGRPCCIRDFRYRDPGPAAHGKVSIIGAGQHRQYGGRYLARGGAVEPVEGGWTPKHIVIVELPTLEKAREWYRSPEYAEALAARQTALDRRLIFVEGATAAAAGVLASGEQQT